jgi:hypothetical protein
VGQEEVIRLDGIRCEEKTADGDGEEALGAFEDGGSGMAAEGRTVADEQAGNVAFDEVLVEISEQMTEALVGPALIV